jgi:hypothetical protein
VNYIWLGHARRRFLPPPNARSRSVLLGGWGRWDDALMKATLVDPRDVTWEVEHPTYRVYFWSSDGAACAEWRVTDVADVHQVLAWADQHVEDAWGYQVFIEVAPESGLGLLRLRGADPTAP